MIKKLIRSKLFTIKETIGESVSKKQEDEKDANVRSICLLANDNAFLLEAFSQGLSEHFDLIITAQNGEEAVELVKSYPQSHFFAIILDIEMPVMDGMEACIKINQYLTEEEKCRGSISSSFGDSRKSSDLSNQHQK